MFTYLFVSLAHQKKNPKPVLAPTTPRGPAQALRDVTNIPSSSSISTPSPIALLGQTPPKSHQLTLGQFITSQPPVPKQRKKKNAKEEGAAEGFQTLEKSPSTPLAAASSSPFPPLPPDPSPSNNLLSPNPTPPSSSPYELPSEVPILSSFVDMDVRGAEPGSDCPPRNCESFPSEMQIELEPTPTTSSGGRCDITDERPIDNGVSAMEGLTVYGSPSPGNREDLWKYMKNKGESSDRAWALGGDFNSIASSDDKSNFNSRDVNRCRKFQEKLYTGAEEGPVNPG
ncbi:hypothetical protein CCACVL1_01704, partial [Corchorus capsularis]